MDQGTQSRLRVFKRNRITRICWFVAILFAIHCVRYLIPGLLVRGFWDPEYAMKLECLEARMKEFPGHPLWLVEGSSRTYYGFQPGMLADRMGDKGAPLVFNFGLLGADLFRQLIFLNRLLEDGVKPARVCIEIHEILLARKFSDYVNTPALVPRARWHELGDYYYGCSRSPATVLAWWLRSRFDPSFAVGVKVEHPRFFSKRLSAFDQWGWSRINEQDVLFREPGDQKKYAALLGNAEKNYDAEFKQDFTISGPNDRALRQILELCKRNGIEVVLFESPEADDFQVFYQAGSGALISSYLQKISTKYRVPVIDARSWFPGPGDFADGQHMNQTGSEKFTRRFFDELLKIPNTQAPP